jgi:hypothetical protein
MPSGATIDIGSAGTETVGDNADEMSRNIASTL